jgi:hypothetical protein
MPATIKCPVCGEVNPSDLEFCQNCQSRLQPLTGPLKGEDAPLQPGQAPTKKVTSELEPILPQWLRQARQQARQSAEEEAAKVRPTTPISHGSDLLDGLASQGKEEEEETPDWLAGITGAPAKRSKKPASEDARVKWVELGRDESVSQDQTTTESSALPWDTSQGHPSEKDELKDWFSQASSAPRSDERVVPAQPAKPAPPPLSPQPPQSEENIEWFKNLEVDASAFGGPSEQPTPPAPSETLDWLKNLDSAAPTYDQASTQHGPAPAAESLNRPGTAPLGDQTPSAAAEVPDWLKNIGEAPAAPPASPAVPAWMQGTAPSREEPPAVPPEPTFDASQPVPDWLSSLKPVQDQFNEPIQPAAPSFAAQEPSTESPAATTPAFTEDSVSTGDVDAIFASMQIPDWLSSATATGQPAAEENPPPAAQVEEEIAPAELPSWVQAMRPVESAIPDLSAGPVDTTLEMQGPLEGLHGVLPAMPGIVAPSSKPKAHSIKLNATDEQQASATLLEQILAAETTPLPMKASSLLASQRFLRWAIAGLLLLFLVIPILAGTQIFPLPALAPAEANLAVQAVDTIPLDAPVLVVFDYEPSTVGEMEAAGASLMDHMLLLKHPRLTLISTSATGPALAERFMSSVLAGENYQRGVQYVDLGYLPGGLAGVYGFAQNPSVVMPYSVDQSAAWQTPPLQNVTRLSDFTAIIILTDQVESGRVWIEQSALTRGNALLILVSSAQAGPMFLPYVDSGQVSGMVAGLNGAVGAEQANGGHPFIEETQPYGRVRYYWDAYSLGLLVTATIIVLGGMWNFAIGLRARAQEAG